MGFVKIETPGDSYGIEYRGKQYVVNPKIEMIEEAEKIFKDEKRRKDKNELKKAIKLFIPDFPIEEIRILEIPLIINGIMKAVEEMIKKVLSPEQLKLWASRNSK